MDDQSVYPTVALPTTMYVGDTITPTFTNIIGGVDLASVFTFKWQDGNSFERYDKAVSPKLTKAGTLKLNVSVKKPYAMQTSGNSSPGSLDAQGTVTQKLLNIVYVDANNGNNNNLGDTTTSALKTVGEAIDHVAEGGTIILLSDCSSSAVIEKSVTIRSADGNKFTFNPSYIYVYKSVNFASVNFEGLTVSKAAGNIGNIAFNNCTGTISSIADSIANVTVENSAFDTTAAGVLSAADTLTLNNSSFSGKFQTNNFVSTGNNTLNIVKNRPSRINGSITIADPITIQVNADDFTKELYEFNAKALVTTWGSKNQAEKGGLKDYSNRQWSGLIGDFYKARWQRWITARTNELSGTDYESNIDWFEWEWEWVRSNKEYPTTATPQDLKTLGAEILENYSVKNPAANDEFDLPTEGMTATAGSAQPQTGKEGPASYVLDKDVSTLWHSKYEGDDQNNLWIDIALGESKTVNGLRILPRNGAVNGVIVEYRIEVSNDNGQSYHEVATGTWTNDSGWKWAQFDQTEATNVRLYAVRTLSDQAGKNFASAAEIRIMAPKKEEPQPEQVNKQFLEFLIGYAQSAKEKPEYEHVVPEVKKALDAALAKAVQVKDNEKASQEQVDEAYTELLEIVHMLDFIGDTTSLKVLVDAVSDKTEKDYTPSTWQPFKSALDAANEVLKNENALDADIEAARTALETAVNGLVKRADFTKLQASVDEAKKAYGDLSGYTEESAAKYTQALTAAETVLKNADASQTEVDQAKTDLETAISGLTAKPSPDKVDKTALQSYVDFAKKYADKEEEYTPSTWNAFKAAYDKAQEVLKDEKAAQKEVDDALAKLQKAAVDLEMKPSKEKLEELKKAIKAAEKKDLSGYTDASVEAYKDVVEKAKTMLSDKEATATEVEDMLKTLKDADKLLVEKDNPQEEDKKPSKEQLEALKEAIKAAEKKDLSGYTDASVKAYKDVLEKAKAVLEDKKATAKDVEDMLKALKDAEKLLVKKDDVKEDEDKNPDSQKGQAVQTGDQTPIMFWAFMLVASAVVIFRRRKRA